MQQNTVVLTGSSQIRKFYYQPLFTVNLYHDRFHFCCQRFSYVIIFNVFHNVMAAETINYLNARKL